MATDSKHSIFAVSILALLLMISLATVKAQTDTNAEFKPSDWYESSLAYRIPITVIEKAGILHNNSMIEVTLNTFNLGPAYQNKMRGDCGDIRVTDANNHLIQFNVTNCNQVNTHIRFRRDIPANYNGVIAYIYYGNSKLTDVSSNVSYWTKKADKTTSTLDAASEKVNNMIYVFGGNIPAIKTVEVYNPKKDIWSSVTSMPDALYAHSSSVIGNAIYIIGGYGPTDNVSVYYTNTDTWSKHISKMSVKRYRQVSESVNGKIYIISGYDAISKKVTDLVEEFDPSTLSWKTKTKIPTARMDATSVVVNDKIYVIGGDASGSIYYNKVEAYDPTTDSWSTKAPLLVARAGAEAVAATDNLIYVFGGTNNNGAISSIEIYNVSKNSWSKGPNMPVANNFFVAEAVDDKIYLIGGSYAKKSTYEFAVPNWKLDISLGSEEPYSGAELCDGKDNDRDGKIDELEDLNPPLCENQIGVCAGATKSCGGAAGWLNCTASDYEKNDRDYQEREMSCSDEIDNDCDGLIDSEDPDCLCPDEDEDGYSSAGGDCGPIDCDDFNPNVHPGAEELCIGNIDEDCDGDPNNGCNKTADVVDAITAPICGNGICESTESFTTCCVDCGCPTGSSCIGNKCTKGEEKPQAVCGDGVCEKSMGESSSNCPADCTSKVPFYAGTLLIILATALFAWWYFVKKPEEELSELTETHGIETPAENLKPSVDKYIANCLSLGYSPEQIKDTLISKGWDEETVNSLLSQAHGDLTALGTLAETYNVSIPSDNISRIKKYISDGLKQGFSATEIKTELLSVGWPENIVEEAFSKHPTLTKDLSSLAEKHKITNPPKNKTKVPLFVKEALNKGHTTSEIKHTLSNMGWSSDIIKKHIPKT